MIRVAVIAKGVPGCSKDPIEIELPADSTVATVLRLVLAAEGVPQPETDLKVFRSVIATVNGRYIPASLVDKTVLGAGDEVTVMPLIVGG
jgi:sulfur carrier protein ThiS